MEDNELIEKVRQGDTDAFAPLVRRHQEAIIRYCSMMLSNPSEAEDAAQEVFIKAYRALKNFKGDSKFSTWLHSIAGNHCLDLLRKRTRQKQDSLDALIEAQGETFERLLTTPVDEITLLERADFVKRIMDRMPEAERAVLLLREMQGFSYEEIASILNLTLEATKSRLFRARESFEKIVSNFSKRGIV